MAAKRTDGPKPPAGEQRKPGKGAETPGEAKTPQNGNMGVVMIRCQGAGEVPLEHLQDFQGELKSLHKDDYARLRKEILELGFSEPCSVWKHKGKIYLLNGHQRIRTLRQMRKEGIEVPAAIPVNWVEASSIKEAKRKVLALTSQYGRIEGQGLYEFMHQADINLEELTESFRFPEIDFDKFGAEYFESPTEGNTDPDEVPDAGKQYVKMGDVWQLGEHTVVCGDSTKQGCPSGYNLMITDPPYGVEYDPEWRVEAAKKGLIGFPASRLGTVANDSTVDWREAWSLFSGSVGYVWHAGRFASQVQAGLESAGFEVRSQIIWAKPSFAISRGHYNWQHEPCWYVVRKGSKADWIGDHSQSTLWQITPVGMHGERNDAETYHGTQKPIDCMARPIRNHKGDVYDPFLGSGTTLIACEQLNRKCYGIEIEPKYAQVAIERWKNFTGKEANKIGGPK